MEQIGQLFDTLDPFPFRERDLDKDAEEYIVGWAREFPRDQHLKIIIHVPESELKTEFCSRSGGGAQTVFCLSRRPRRA